MIFNGEIITPEICGKVAFAVFGSQKHQLSFLERKEFLRTLNVESSFQLAFS